jgi:hypothetical protein
VFLTLMVIGLVGLFVMALPAFSHHGVTHNVHGHTNGLGRIGSLRAARSEAMAAAQSGILAAHPTTKSLLRFVPSPRAVCSVLALYGAFGNALMRAAHLQFAIAAVLAFAPALLVEWVVVRPVWNLLFRFQGQPSSPLEALILTEATALVPFRNGKGVVSAIRDGRAVQFSARLASDQISVPVKVGDLLRIEDVDAAQERVTVTPLSTRGSLPE